MGLPVNEIVNGRKTFFITPDTSLMPELYLLCLVMNVILLKMTNV